jgi:hypothetical protein
MPRRKTSWAIIIWTLVLALWIVAGIAGNDCASETGDGVISDQAAEDACAVGTGIGVAAIFFLWFIGFIVLSIVWLLTKNRNKRDCPVCGRSVKRGVVRCGSCGYDFRQGQRTTMTTASG